MARLLAYPVSVPAQIGDDADSACRWGYQLSSELTIGMTWQVSDTELSVRALRRTGGHLPRGLGRHGLAQDVLAVRVHEVVDEHQQRDQQQVAIREHEREPAAPADRRSRGVRVLRRVGGGRRVR